MKSIMHSKADNTCYLCMVLHSEYSTQTELEEHHVIYGRGKRALSEKYGLKVYLCPRHHRDSPESIHHNTKNNLSLDYMLKEKAQQAFEEHFPELSFLEIFGKQYAENRINTPSERKSDSINGFIEIGEWLDDKSTKRMADL